ncbi:hypothetical protein IHE55_08255 [Streptomyces pactum]|uniref:Lipoprotein n=1 Tax=Streptomyces pactum TaxID=68249 RepID=A0ABS0NI47_9ACTN|nr:hypothetical protein [Streptomyces pactum]MBH5334787.1 hypothetical protein [Streptomyces pactum]
MRVSRHREPVRRVAGGRLLAAVAVTGAAMALTVACEPDDDRGLTAIGVAYTTDKVATEALERGRVQVRWLTCSGDAKGDERAGASRTPVREVAVRCRGRTEQGDADIQVDGVVTYERKGACVKGDLTAKLEGRQVFRADVIGDCGSAEATRRAS